MLSEPMPLNPGKPVKNCAKLKSTGNFILCRHGLFLFRLLCHVLKPMTVSSTVFLHRPRLAKQMVHTYMHTRTDAFFPPMPERYFTVCLCVSGGFSFAVEFVWVCLCVHIYMYTYMNIHLFVHIHI